jgi:hypothetical protein
VRNSRRRIVAVSGVFDAVTLVNRIADGLGAPPDYALDRGHAWRSLERAYRIRSLEGFHVVVAIDDCRGLDGFTESIARALVGLAGLAPRERRGITVIEIRGLEPDESPMAEDRWEFCGELKPLTRSESQEYLYQKLAAAGTRDQVFAPRAITRLQSISAGVPRVLERLATLSLMATAVHGLPVVPPEAVDDVAGEWQEVTVIR